MSQSTRGFTPIPDPVHSPAMFCRGQSARLAELFTREQLDSAIDRAARCARATIAMFTAAPRARLSETAPDAAALEFAIEFFVPPTSHEAFHRELEAQLLQLSAEYVTGRCRGEFLPCVLHDVGSGAFHQYRKTIGLTSADQRESRWSGNRAMLEGVLLQARTGWRELSV